MKERILLRSFMFVPAYNRKFITKALESKTDAIILDLEDSVPGERRAEAREVVKQFAAEGVFKNKNVFVRINPIGTQDFVDDISEMILPDIKGFMLSKIDTPEDIVFIDKLLSFMEMKNHLAMGTFMLAPLIETTLAVANVQAIATASDRLVALCLGGEDYLNDLGSVYTYQESALSYPRAMLVNAARSVGILPIDTPYINISDTEGFEAKETLAYKNGFAGCLILNPKQIEPANRAFSPDEEKIAYSQRVNAAVKEAVAANGSGIVMLDGGMVGPPMKKRAESVLEQIERINLYTAR